MTGFEVAGSYSAAPLNEVEADKMLRDLQTAGLVKLPCRKGLTGEKLLWADCGGRHLT